MTVVGAGIDDTGWCVSCGIHTSPVEAESRRNEVEVTKELGEK